MSYVWFSYIIHRMKYMSVSLSLDADAIQFYVVDPCGHMPHIHIFVHEQNPPIIFCFFRHAFLILDGPLRPTVLIQQSFVFVVRVSNISDFNNVFFSSLSPWFR